MVVFGVSQCLANGEEQIVAVDSPVHVLEGVAGERDIVVHHRSVGEERFHGGPVHQIVGIPVGQGLAANAVDGVPGVIVLAAHAQGQGQIGGEDVEAAGGLIAADGHVAHAMVAIIRPEDGLPVVQGLPMEAVTADGEIHLLAVRGGLFADVDEQIILHWIFLLVQIKGFRSHRSGSPERRSLDSYYSINYSIFLLYVEITSVFYAG